MKHHFSFDRRAWVLVASAAAYAMVASAANAQPAAPESAPAFTSFSAWAQTRIVTATETAPSTIESLKPAIKGGAVAVRFEPLPVINGVPELPLLGVGARNAARFWGGALNYQGLHAQYLLVDQKTRKLKAAPLSTRLAAGQRFKIRLVTTFDGVAAVDQLLGSAFDAQRSGQVYPATGTAVEIKADKAVTLPSGENQFFVLSGQPRNERLVLSVRHAAAASSNTTQPAYRQETARASSYLQLTPRGSLPIFEQILTSGR